MILVSIYEDEIVDESLINPTSGKREANILHRLFNAGGSRKNVVKREGLEIDKLAALFGSK